MSMAPGAATGSQEAFDRLLVELRPKLHRYCARMTGSVVDGEDVVQEAIMKAMVAFRESAVIDSQESWLFRVAHNAALDFLRRRNRIEAAHAPEDINMLVDPVSATENREVTVASLRTFMRLPTTQRSAVILMDVLGYSLGEVAQVIHASIPAVKATLHRGRSKLRELALEPDDLPSPSLDAVTRSRLMDYADRFNAREFDAVREMLADDVKLELVNRTRMNGVREVAGRYFHNYGRVDDWKLVAGLVDRHPAVLVQDPRDPTCRWQHFVLLEWAGDLIVNIRDFRYASYVTECAELLRLEVASQGLHP
jgi:RNA polymerase sigma-70 factor, ECF subfamily